MRVLVYRPDKKVHENANVDAECLYYPSGKKYTRPREREREHPLDKITKAKISSSFVEVER